MGQPTKSIVAKVAGSRLARSTALAIAGFLAYGIWGFFCNLMHGVGMGVQSGLVQGTLSFTITLASNFVMEAIYGFLGSKFFTALLTSILVVSIPYAVNLWVGTPEILLTIAPGAVLGVIYVITYVSALHKFLEANKQV